MRLAVLAAAAVMACGGTVTPGGQQNCSITLSGAATGTYACLASGAYANNNNRAGVAVNPTGANTGVTVGIGWTGQFQTGTYKNTDASAEGGVSYSTPGGQTAWLASASGGNVVGSYTLNVTSTGTTITGNNGQGYENIHGTLDATLPAVAGTGATGTVTLHASF